jgi:hypothetical protein
MESVRGMRDHIRNPLSMEGYLKRIKNWKIDRLNN